MKFSNYLKQLEQDAEYQATMKELQPYLDIANDVLELRLKNGWSQSELAERANTKQANISRLESGLANPTVSFLQKIANAFSTDLEIRICPKNKIEYSKIIEVPIPIEVRYDLWPRKLKKTRWAPEIVEA